MLDLAQLLPHCKRDSKLDTKTDRGVINEVADMKVVNLQPLSLYCSTYRLLTMARTLQGCSSVLFFEARKRKDLYIWLARAPDGPSIKFHCANGEDTDVLQSIAINQAFFRIMQSCTRTMFMCYKHSISNV